MSEIITYKPSEMADAILGLDASSIRLQSIEVTNPPNKTLYGVNETFDPTGIFVEGNYSNDLKKDVTSNTTYNPNVIPSIATKKVTASYTEKGITKQADININNVNITSWSTGTDAEIMNMVIAADMGLIDLTDYWHVGDERVIHLSSMPSTDISESHVEQDITMVLVDKNNQNYTYTTTPSSGRTYPFFIVQQKIGLVELGYMHHDTTICSWSNCDRRTWCNDIYRNAFSSSIKNIFHQVKVKSSETYNGTTILESDDYFFLPAAAEVFKGDSTYGQGGSFGRPVAYSNLNEFNVLTRWEYYATIDNRKKIIEVGGTGLKNYWWERSLASPVSNYPYFCRVNTDGSAATYRQHYEYQIVPAGCI